MFDLLNKYVKAEYRRRQRQTLNGYFSGNIKSILLFLKFYENADLMKLLYEEIMVNDRVLTEKNIIFHIEVI